VHFIKLAIIRTKIQKAVLSLDESPKVFFALIFAKKPRPFLKKIFYTIGQWFCVKIFILTGIGKYSRIQSSIPWVVILSTDDIYLKISWRVECIDHEINNMQLLSKFEQLRMLIVPFHRKNRLWYSVIETQRRYPITDDYELFNAAERILKRFQCCAVVSYNNLIEDFEQIINGLNVICEICGPVKRQLCANKVKELMEKEPFYIGPAHGDFHPKNILKDLNGNDYIIDLDCFRLQGIQALDAIYFVNEYYANKNNINWYQQLILFLENKQEYSPVELPFLESFFKKYCVQWLLMYFLDRVGQERAYVATVDEMPVREITGFLNSYIKIWHPSFLS
jgi:hypothetical protein